MSSGTSYNGWPASDDKASIGVVSSEWFPGGAKAGDVTTVLRHVAVQFNARVETIVGGWCWGYTYKANVNNPSQLSCHASGTAIDINAPDHPNGSSGTFTDDQVGEIYAILAECQGAVSWLEGYDEMHFEIQVGAADLAAVAALLGDAAPPPTQGDWFDMATEDDLTRIVNDALVPIQQQLDALASADTRTDTANRTADVLAGVTGTGKDAQFWQSSQATNAFDRAFDRNADKLG